MLPIIPVLLPCKMRNDSLVGDSEQSAFNLDIFSKHKSNKLLMLSWSGLAMAAVPFANAQR